MLGGILGRKNFKTKCKSALTRTRTELDAIKRKRNAMQKFLKKDIAELLKSNLDRNAYSRAEGLFFELNLSSCYDYVDECCKWVSEHLNALHEKRECPEESRVAVSSLMYASARFSDLPQLRDLRNQFNTKFGGSLVPFVNKEFVENLKSKPPTMEMKIQLIEDVAHQFSIKWNPASLEQKLQIPSLPAHNHGVSDGHNLSRSRSAKLQGEDKKELDHRVKQTTATTREKISHTDSCPVVRGDVSYTVDYDHTLKPTPKSVRTKFLNPSLSSVNFHEHEIDIRTAPTADLLGDEADNDVWAYFGKVSPISAKTVHFPLPVYELPLPPGRRRYFSEDEKPKNEALLSPKSAAERRVCAAPADFDELLERIAVLKHVSYNEAKQM